MHVEGHPLTFDNLESLVRSIPYCRRSTRYNTPNPQPKNVTAIAFAGTVVGQLFFGWMSDHYSRKWALLTSTVILFIFAALGAGSYGGGSVNGIFQALVAYRFLLGIGIGYVHH